MQFRQIVGTTVALGLLTSGLTFAQQPDRRVAVVAQGAPLRVDDKVVGSVARGQIFVVRGSRGQWWNVGAGTPRWIHKRHALPLDRALEHFNETIQRDPRDAGAYHARGAVFVAQGDYDRGIADFGKSIQLRPDSASYYADRGSAWFRNGDYDRALEDLSEALRLKPDYVSGYVNRAAVRTALGEHTKAIADYSEAIRLRPNLATAYRSRGVVWKLLGEYEKAVADMDACLLINPNDAGAHNNLAWIWATCPDPSVRSGGKALESATRACELTGWKRAGYLDTLAAAYAEAGQFTKAVEVMTRALEAAAAKKQPDLRARRELYRSERPYREEADEATSRSSGVPG